MVYRKVKGPGWANRDPNREERREKFEHNSAVPFATVCLYTTITAMNPP